MFKQKKILSLIVGFIGFASISLIISVSYNIIYFQYDLKNATRRVLLYPLEETKWIPGFSETKFSQIRTGMNEKEVLHLLGKPLIFGDKSSSYSYYWAYTWYIDDNDGAYDHRIVYFDTNGRVSDVERSFK